MIAKMDSMEETEGRGRKIDGETEHDAISLPDQRADIVRQESPKRLHHHQ